MNDGEAAYRTALTDVLRTISRASFDLPAVFASVLEHAARLCRAVGWAMLNAVKGVARSVAAVNVVGLRGGSG